MYVVMGQIHTKGFYNIICLYIFLWSYFRSPLIWIRGCNAMFSFEWIYTNVL